MLDLENWISLPQAVAIVKTAIGMSQGPTQQKLIAICESGDVRARWSGHHMKARPPIHKRDWVGADIDWANFRVVKADGTGMAGVDFSEEDLKTWIAQQSMMPQSEIGRATEAGARLTAEQAALALISDRLKAEPGLTRAAMFAMAKGTIPDLQDKEFERAWLSLPAALKRGPGRPNKNPLGNTPI
jgi:hypothetical protein